MKKDNRQHYILQGKEDIHVQDVMDGVMRISYGNVPEENITDACVGYPKLEKKSESAKRWI